MEKRVQYHFAEREIAVQKAKVSSDYSHRYKLKEVLTTNLNEIVQYAGEQMDEELFEIITVLIKTDFIILSAEEVIETLHNCGLELQSIIEEIDAVDSTALEQIEFYN